MRAHCLTIITTQCFFICADRFAPRNVRMKAVNSSTVEMTWSSPLEVNGDFNGYFVHWYRDDGGLRSTYVYFSARHVFTGLQPGQNVTASVSARADGRHYYSNNVSVTTPPMKGESFPLNL